MAKSPIITLWAIWTKLSMLENLPITVESKTALVVVFDPIVVFSIITFPLWNIFCFDFSSKPKPEPPILV